MELIKPGRVIDFMGMRRFWVAFSGLLVLVSAFLLWKPGPKYGIDFTGGTEVTIRFDRRVDAGAVRQALSRRGYGHAEVVPSERPPNTFIIRVDETQPVSPENQQRLRRRVRERLGEVQMGLQEFRISPGGDHLILQLSGQKTDTEVAQLVRDAATDVGTGGHAVVRVRGDRALRVGQVEERRWQVPLESVGDVIFGRLQEELNTTGSLQASVWVSPRAGRELRNQAIRAVLYSIVFIMIYVAFRFDLRFAPGGILGLLHDALVTLGVFVIFRKEVTISTVAAILTVVGYSMNDTIIVYDRIRENLAKRRGLRMIDVINVSVSETFSRTIVTSSTVILSMVPFTIWGSGVIRDFAWALIVGVLAGTYSSIYVAAPLTEWIDSRFFHTNPPAPSAPQPPAGGTSGRKGAARAEADAAT